MFQRPLLFDQLTLRCSAPEASVTIWVEKPGQKAIVIGKGGARLKEVGTAARLALERLLDRPVFLHTQVRQQDGWTENARVLSQIERDGQ